MLLVRYSKQVQSRWAEDLIQLFIEDFISMPDGIERVFQTYWCLMNHHNLIFFVVEVSLNRNKVSEISSLFISTMLTWDEFD